MSNGSEQTEIYFGRIEHINHNETEHYVKLNMSRDQRRILAKLRSCILPLEIEKGRYTRPKIPINERICKFCDAHA